MQAIEIPDNPSPLNFFAIPSHTALNYFNPAMVPQIEVMFGMAIPNQTLSTISCIRQCKNLLFS